MSTSNVYSIPAKFSSHKEMKLKYLVHTWKLREDLATVPDGLATTRLPNLHGNQKSLSWRNIQK
jgi:hypothetical protein